MANENTWQKVHKYFKKNSTIDNWGDTKTIDDRHLLRLFDFREYLGVPIYITHGVKASGHSKRSYHYSRFNAAGNQIGACATDIMIPDYPRSAFDLVLDATRFGFGGVGFYTHWQWHGKTIGGLHVDSRALKWDKDGTKNYSQSRWIGILNAKGEQEYIAMTALNLTAYLRKSDD